MSSKEDLESEVQRLLAMNTKTVDSKTESVKSPVKKENKKKGKSGAGDEKTPLLNDGGEKKGWGISC